MIFSWDGWGSRASACLGAPKLFVVFGQRGEAGGASAPGTTDAKRPWGAGRWLRQPRAVPRRRQESIAARRSLRMRVPPRWHTVGGVVVPTLAAAVASVGWCCTGTYQNLSLHHPQPSVAADTHRQE